MQVTFKCFVKYKKNKLVPKEEVNNQIDDTRFKTQKLK